MLIFDVIIKQQQYTQNVRKGYKSDNKTSNNLNIFVFLLLHENHDIYEKFTQIYRK